MAKTNKRKTQRSPKTLILCFMSMLCLGTAAFAYEWELTDKLAIDIHGSASQGFLYTKNNNIWFTDSSEGEFEFTDLLLNVSTNLTPKLRLGAQFMVRDFGDTGDNRFAVDWAFFDYHWKDWMGFRLGKIKLPYGMYHEMVDIDFARSTIFLPPIYEVVFRDVLSSGDGVGLYGDVPMGKFGSLSYQALAVRNTLDKECSLSSVLTADAPFDVDKDIDGDEMYVFNLTWDTPVEGLRLGTCFSDFRDTTVAVNTNQQLGPWFLGIPAGKRAYLRIPSRKAWFFSAEYTRGNLVISSELARTDYYRYSKEIRSFGPNTNDGAWYIQAAYRWNDWFESTIGYGVVYADWHHKHGYKPEGVAPLPVLGQIFFPNRMRREDGWMARSYLSARFDVKPYWVVKAEIHYMDGLKGVSFEDNRGGRKDSDVMFALRSTWFF